MRRTGHWLRFIGLFIEMIGVVGVIRERGGQSVPQIRLPDGHAISIAWTAVSLGFVLWLLGKIILVAARPRSRDRA